MVLEFFSGTDEIIAARLDDQDIMSNMNNSEP